MNIFLTTLGCRLNEAEIAHWTRALRSAGFGVVSRADRADIVLLNTCVVTTEAARKSRKLASRLHRENPLAKLVLTGCYASVEPESVAALAGADLVIDNARKDRLVQVLLTELDIGNLPPRAQSADDITAPATNGHTRAFVKVQDGCRHRCSFCVVTIARGQERSRPIDAVVAEVDLLHRRGVQEVVLTGVHLGGYGSDLHSDLGTLVKQILQRTSIARLRLSSLEPWNIGPAFWKLWKNRRLCPHLHLPLQSGSDAVLRRMGRRCDTASYERIVRDARAAIPDLVLTTDVIVGFPGESDDDFAATLTMCRKVGFAHVHIFSYSPRPGTAAASMSDQVASPVKRARSLALHRLGEQIKAQQLARFTSTSRQVLWEGFGEQLSAGHRRWVGLTENYLRVETAVAAHVQLANRITPAHIIAAKDDRLIADIDANALADLSRDGSPAPGVG